MHSTSAISCSAIQFLNWLVMITLLIRVSEQERLDEWR
jgi:hypothetical protein